MSEANSTLAGIEIGTAVGVALAIGLPVGAGVGLTIVDDCGGVGVAVSEARAAGSVAGVGVAVGVDGSRAGIGVDVARPLSDAALGTSQSPSYFLDGVGDGVGAAATIVRGQELERVCNLPVQVQFKTPRRVRSSNSSEDRPSS